MFQISKIHFFGSSFTLSLLSLLSQLSLAQTMPSWTTGIYHESNLTYDLNGNIKTLTRNGQNGSLLDDLTYTYNGNQLLAVADAGDKAKGFIDGSNTNDDYAYDAVGSLISDKNKDITSIEYNELNLPQKVTKSNGDYVRYTYDANGRKLSKQVFNARDSLLKKVTYVSDFYYENDTLKFINHAEGRVVMNNGSPEYQYYLKDHLGNTRVTFTTRPQTSSVTATLEAEASTKEQSQFLNYDQATKIDYALFDHSQTDKTHYSARLTGVAGDQFGLAKSLSVMPGDKINVEVYAKYIDPDSRESETIIQDLLALASQVSTGGTGLEGKSVSTSQAFVPVGSLIDKSGSSNTAPKAYLNYLVYDRDFILRDGGFVQITENAKENGTGVPHERLSKEIEITEAGYVYIYLSNESETPVDVFFDDFKVEQVESSVVQTEDYYPFGYSFNSYQRENSLTQNFLYNGKELQQELGLDLYDYGARLYNPLTGRWGAVDPLAEKYSAWSPYNYALNDPLRFVDPDGRHPVLVAIAPFAIGAAVGGLTGMGVEAASQVYFYVVDKGTISGFNFNYNEINEKGFDGAAMGLGAPGGPLGMAATFSSYKVLRSYFEGKEFTLGNSYGNFLTALAAGYLGSGVNKGLQSVASGEASAALKGILMKLMPSTSTTTMVTPEVMLGGELGGTVGMRIKTGVKAGGAPFNDEERLGKVLQVYKDATDEQKRELLKEYMINQGEAERELTEKFVPGSGNIDKLGPLMKENDFWQDVLRAVRQWPKDNTSH